LCVGRRSWQKTPGSRCGGRCASLSVGAHPESTGGHRAPEFRDLTLEEEEVAEIDYQPRKAEGHYRLIVLRKRIRVAEGQLRLDDEIRYFFYVTNIPMRQLGTAGVVRENNARCHQESLIEQLKNGVQATRMPVREFDGNWATWSTVKVKT
jgi:hypothetical protein